MSIAREVGKSKPTVWRWQERYVAQGIAGLKRDASRPGRKPPLAPEVIAQVVDKTLHEKPPAATQWSTRTMAQTVGLSQTSVRRIWHAHGLKPHLVRGLSCQMTSDLSRKSKMSSASTWARRTRRWC